VRNAIAEVAEVTRNTSAACAAAGVAPATYYRSLKERPQRERQRRGTPPRRLSQEERERVLLVLHEDRFVDKPVRQVYATLLDEDVYLGSERTMYRILEENGEVKERRDQLRHPKHPKPELVATKPNEVWSWDTTKVRGPEKGVTYWVYVIIDIYSRYVVGWTIAEREDAEIAEALIAQAIAAQQPSKNLVIHSDRGGIMVSNNVTDLLITLGVKQSLSRPRVSNDNPYSESHFKTMKNAPIYPGNFGSIQDARNYFQRFFDWYNTEHYHTGIGLMTPFVVHYGLAETCLKARQSVLRKAFFEHPERFVRGMPRPRKPPEAAWINAPAPTKPKMPPHTVASGKTSVR